METHPGRPGEKTHTGCIVTCFAVTIGLMLFGVVVWINYEHLTVHDTVASSMAEMRNLAVAIESFRQAHGRLPTVREFYAGDRAPNGIPSTDPPIQYTLTSPVALIAAMPGDPFTRGRRYHYHYYTDGKLCWMLGTVGPDGRSSFFSGAEGGWKNERSFVEGTPGLRSAGDPRFFYPASKGGAPGAADYLYDPTNGLRSRGDIIQTGP